MAKYKPIRDGNYPQHDIDFIMANHLTMPVNQMAIHIGRSEFYVVNLKKVSGIVTPLQIRNEFKKSTQIKPGNVPFNKGVSIDQWMSLDQQEKIKATQFKKGQKVHNEKADGFITWRNNNTEAFIRISKGKWIQLKHALWIAHHGEIPAGNLIQYKDGNSRNCVIENLYCCPRNISVHENRYGGYKNPWELRKAIQNITILKRKIHEYEKQINRSEQSSFPAARKAQ